MARWNEEQERWTGHGDRYGEDERRFRGERGEGGWRGRGWRADERLGAWSDEDEPSWRGAERDRPWGGSRHEIWRAGERGGEGWRRERGAEGWGRERGGEGWRGGGGREHGERWRGEGADWGPYGATGIDPWPGERGAMSGMGMYGGEYGGGGAWPMDPDPGRRFGRPSHERGGWGDDRSYGSSAGERDYGHPEWTRDRDRGRHERGAMERFGDKLREGVRKLTGKPPKGYRRSDERVRDEVCERIARSGVNADAVEVAVSNGEVTLTGFVERRDEKRAIEDLADDVFGVDEVHNHVRVRREGQPSTQPLPGAGTGTTGTGAAMSARQQTTRPATSQDPGHSGRH
jgi:hypothetical protein